MKFSIQVFGTILLLAGMTVCTSCSKAVSIGDSLPEMDAHIMVVFQDKQENYWFGSGDTGVYKYDGKHFVRFSKKDGLCSNSILGIQEDSFGNIYFDTDAGISKYDGQQFTTLEVIESDSSEDEWKLEAGDLWFRMGWDSNGPYRYDGTSLYHLTFPKSDQEDSFYAKYPHVTFNPYGVYYIYTDSKGCVWFGTSSLGLCRYDGKTISWLYENHLTETPEGGAFGIRSIIEDKDGYFWFCNSRYRYDILPESSRNDGISKLNYRKEKGMGYPLKDGETDFPYFMSIVEDKQGDLWMATYSEGVYRYNGEKLIHYPLKDGDTDVLLFSIYKDRQAKLWLVSHNAGIYVYNGSSFEKFRGE